MKRLLLGLVAAALILFATTPAMAHRYPYGYRGGVYAGYAPVYRPYYAGYYYPRRVYYPTYPAYPVYPAYPAYPGYGVGVATPGFSFTFGR